MKREWSLDGQWTLYYGDAICHETFDEEKLECVPAQVPGNVELDLSRAGVLPEDLFKGMSPMTGGIVKNLMHRKGIWMKRSFCILRVWTVLRNMN